MFFKHKYITNPSVTPEDAMVAAANNLSNAIKRNMTVRQIGQQRYDDIIRLHNIFKYAATLPRVQADTQQVSTGVKRGTETNTNIVLDK